MKRWLRILRLGIPLLIVVAVVLWFGLPAELTPPSATAPSALSDTQASGGDGVVLPLPAVAGVPAARIALGERLFHEPRLSGDESIACADCHDLRRGGVDGRKVAVGVGGAVGGINAPTVFNSSLSFVQFWDGRAATLEEQAPGPIHNPIEMASDWQRVLSRLKADTSYAAEFAAIYPDGITPATVVDAIASFERALLTPDSRFDLFLKGDRTALTGEEIDGYRRFRELGCSACHQGVLLGGNMYQKFGVLRDYFAGRTPTPADLGRFNVTGREEDRHVFKVPSLRNIALTAPYFHDASADTLEQAVQVMGRYQLGRELAPHDVQLIVAFLRSLTGQWRGKSLG